MSTYEQHSWLSVPRVVHHPGQQQGTWHQQASTLVCIRPVAPWVSAVGQAMCLHQAVQLPGTKDVGTGKAGPGCPAVTAQFAHNAGCWHGVYCCAACSCSGQGRFDGVGAAAATSPSMATAHRPAQPAEPATEGFLQAGRPAARVCLLASYDPFSGAGSCKPPAQQCVFAYLRTCPCKL